MSSEDNTVADKMSLQQSSSNTTVTTRMLYQDETAVQKCVRASMAHASYISDMLKRSGAIENAPRARML